MSSKIHPAEKQCKNLGVLKKQKEIKGTKKSDYVLTVWKRSSISFQGTDGFTVFDSNGKLVFRVDNYSRKNPNLVLMDGVGNALLTFKPQRMNLHNQWNAYDQDQDSKVFSMRKESAFNGKSGAEIFMGPRKGQQCPPDFKIEGSFRARDCKIKDSNGHVVAFMARKRVNTSVLLGDDVFSLVISPGFDSHLIMAFVIILDRISNHSVTPFLCS
ncbi:hypothetical protein M5689_009627 [Euphorbia peplus]|nr:hypothetical protein M5689_009627 [Euphorbia peplus]